MKIWTWCLCCKYQYHLIIAINGKLQEIYRSLYMEDTWDNDCTRQAFFHSKSIILKTNPQKFIYLHTYLLCYYSIIYYYYLQYTYK